MTSNLPFRTVVITLILGLSVAAIILGEINLGIDLRGGSILTYQVERLAEGGQVQTGDETITNRDLEDTIGVISERINREGLKDIQVRQEGTRQFTISMAGFTDKQEELIREKMTQVGQLEFPIVCSPSYDAATYAPYSFNKEEFDRQYFDSLQANATDRARPIWTPPGPFRWAPRRPQREKGEDKGTYEKRISDYRDKLENRPWELKDQGDWLFYHEDYWGNPAQGRPGFTGRDIDSPTRSTDERGGLAVSFGVREAAQNFLSAYSDKFLQKTMALVLNGEIWSTANIREQLSDNVQISGGTLGFSEQEQGWLVSCLQSGSLKLKPNLLSNERIGATLGAKSIERGTLAFILGTLLVVSFMLWFYKIGGVLAIFSQVANFAMIFACMIILDASLTLPGIAGLVLTIGMAVDANILVFERIREELSKGKTLPHACANGFDRALITIVDSNLTTFVPAAFLASLGKGPIKGFGYTLMVGIVCTLFATTYLTRTLLGLALKNGWIKELSFRQILDKTNVPFSKYARKATMISAGVIALGLVFVFITPDSRMYSLDFNGGTQIRLKLNQPISRSDALEQVQNIKTADGKTKYDRADAFVIGPVDAKSDTIELRLNYVASTKTAASADAEGLDEFRQIQDELAQAFAGKLVSRGITNVVYDPATTSWNGQINFPRPIEDLGRLQTLVAESGALKNVLVTQGADNKTFLVSGQVASQARQSVEAEISSRLAAVEGFEVSNPFPKARFLGEAVVADLTISAWYSTVFSLAFILLYMWFRFKEFEYGVAATVALIHDVLVALGMTVMFNALGLVDAAISLDVLAAFLTIIGYSLNDTIVIFDRIRENLGNTRGTFTEIIDRSVNQTLSRTILTALTVFLTVFAVFATNYGIESPLEGFSFTMLIGTLAGTYSTVYIASPIVIWFHERNLRRKEAASAAHRAPVAAKG